MDDYDALDYANYLIDEWHRTRCRCTSEPLAEPSDLAFDADSIARASLDDFNVEVERWLG